MTAMQRFLVYKQRHFACLSLSRFGETLKLQNDQTYRRLQPWNLLGLSGHGTRRRMALVEKRRVPG
jgi:hypothetical protein